MEEFKSEELKKLYVPPVNSHKGQNGKLLIVAGSALFHAPAIWSAAIASRIVDMVYVASTEENNRLLQSLKGKFWDGIVVRREDLDDYAKEADCILIGPGLPREEGRQDGDDDSRDLVRHVLCDLLSRSKVSHLPNRVIGQARKNGALQNNKRMVIDGGALQVMELDWIPEGAILTPHKGEFKRLLELAGTKFFSETNPPSDIRSDTPAVSERAGSNIRSLKNLYTASSLNNIVENFAKQHECIVLLKGKEDIVCSPTKCRIIKGGNAGMTKGGTGDVLAGLAAALACKNDPFLAACAGSYINKAAGDALFERVGYYFNASDLVKEIPKVMKRLS